MNLQNFLVIGGSGFIGSAIARKLAAQGRKVVVPTRRRDRAKHLILLPTVDVIEADIHDSRVLDRMVAGADAVINLVGVLHSDTARPFGMRFKKAHVDLPRKIAAACAVAGVPRLLHMSALGAAADGPSMYLRSKAAGEAAVRETAGKVATTVFRPSVVFGRDDKFINLFARMQGLAPIFPVGHAGARLQPVHVEDLAQAMVNAADNPVTFGRAYDLGGPHVYTLKQIIQYAGKVSGHPRPVIGLPDALAYLQAWLMEFAPFELLSRDNLDSLKVDSVTSSVPFAPELGVIPVSMEAVVPGYLAGHSPRERYMQLRDRAGR